MQCDLSCQGQQVHYVTVASGMLDSQDKEDTHARAKIRIISSLLLKWFFFLTTTSQWILINYFDYLK